MAEVTIRAKVDGTEQDITLDDDSLPDGLLSLRHVRAEYVPKTQLKTVRDGFDAEVRKATEGKYTPDELVADADALQALMPQLVTSHRDVLLEQLGVKPNGEVDAQLTERITAQLRTKEVVPLEKQVGVLADQVKALRVERLRNDVLAACREVGVVEGLDELLVLHYQQRCVWDDEHDRWFMVGPDGRPDVAVGHDRPEGAPPFRTVADDLADTKTAQDARTRHWFASTQRDGIGYGGASRTATAQAKPRAKMSTAEKAAFIKEHGYDAFTKLPAE
jgi:hypothetical protein